MIVSDFFLTNKAERRIAKCGGNFASSSMPQSSRMPRARSRRSQRAAEPGETRLRGRHRQAQVDGPRAVVKKKIGDDHFDVEIGSMKMRIHREDIAEVLATAQGNSQPLSSPVEAARSRGITVKLQNEFSDLNTPSEINVIGRTVDEATAKSRIHRPRVSRRNAARACCTRQRHGDSAQGAAPVPKETPDVESLRSAVE